MYANAINFRAAWLHIAIWGFLLLLPGIIFPVFFPESSRPSLPAGLFFTGVNLSSIGLFYLNAYYLYPRLMNRKWWWLYLIIIPAIFGLLYLVKMAIIRMGYPTIPLDPRSGFTRRFAIFSPLPFFIASLIYRSVLNHNQREKRMKEMQASQLTTELKFLRSQVNPHFLFNVLANLASLARTGSSKLEPSLVKLADLLRYMLYNSGEKKVRIMDEVQYLESYIELQELRFGDDVAIVSNFDVAEDQVGLTIEPMLLIPFVENAFKHGTGWIENPAIFIRLTLQEGLLELTVRNKFNEAEKSKDPHSGIGLANVLARLNILYPDHHELQQTQTNDLYIVHLSIRLT